MPVLLRQTAPWLLALILTLLSLLFPQPASTLAPWFFLSSALILGVPHGACDPWIPGWVLRRPTKIPFFLIFFIVYLSISAAYLLLWRSYPLPSTLFFLALTAWHWGTADASLESSPTLFSRPSVHQTIETFLLLFLFYLTPPLLSVGTYFVAFHAWRHLLRLSALRDQLNPIDPIPRWTHSVRQLLLLSIPLTLASLAFLRWIPPFLTSSFPQGQNWVGPYLILLAVLTLPHALLVGWIDKRNITQL